MKTMKCPQCGQQVRESQVTTSGWTHVRPMTSRERQKFHATGRDPRPDVTCEWGR